MTLNNQFVAPEQIKDLKKPELLLARMQELRIESYCRDWHQYNKAKRLIEGLSSSPEEYEFLIEIIKNYLNI